MNLESESLRSKILHYYFTHGDNCKNSYILNAVNAIVDSDLQSEKNIGWNQTLNKWLEMITKYTKPFLNQENKNFLPCEQEIKDIQEHRKMYKWTRDRFVNSFFNDTLESSAQMIEKYCQNDLEVDRNFSFYYLGNRLWNVVNWGIDTWLEYYVKTQIEKQALDKMFTDVLQENDDEGDEGENEIKIAHWNRVFLGRAPKEI